MTTRETQYELYRALKAHRADLEITRRTATRLDQEIDRRIEAVLRLLEWLSQALEPVLAAFPEVSPAPMTISGMVNSL
jgi:hypothetical protein